MQDAQSNKSLITATGIIELATNNLTVGDDFQLEIHGLAANSADFQLLSTSLSSIKVDHIVNVSECIEITTQEFSNFQGVEFVLEKHYASTSDQLN